MDNMGIDYSDAINGIVIFLLICAFCTSLFINIGLYAKIKIDK